MQWRINLKGQKGRDLEGGILPGSTGTAVWGLGFTWTLRCSSFLGLVWFLGWGSYSDYQKRTTLEGLGRV